MDLRKLWDLTDKTAIVTGGRHGNLGPIWVETLKKAGAEVVAFDLPDVDMGDNRSIDMAVRDFLKEYSSPDIIVNNAAIDNPPGSNSTFFGNFEKIMQVNLNGHIHLVSKLLPGMIKDGGGVIVNIGSIQGYGASDWRNYPDGFEKPCGYGLSKAALKHFSKCLTGQYGRYGIRSVTISFGCVDTPKIKPEFAEKYLTRVAMGRMISKESLQASMLYACCCPDLAGTDFLIDGGRVIWA